MSEARIPSNGGPENSEPTCDLCGDLATWRVGEGRDCKILCDGHGAEAKDAGEEVWALAWMA